MENDHLVDMLGISKSFGPVKALENVDFYVDRKEVAGLVGDNGAGKSTLIKILSGVHPADSGRIFFEGKEVHIKSPLQARNLGIETIYQDLALVEELNIYRNIFLAKEFKKSLLYVISLLDEGKMKEEARHLLDRLSISIGSVDYPVRHLSGGQRQCVAVARSVYYDAKLLVMDEPTAALGVAESRQVLDLVKKLKDQGKSVIVITHNLHHIFSVCDRITVLRKGRVVGSYMTKDVTIGEIEDLIVGRSAQNFATPRT